MKVNKYKPPFLLIHYPKIQKKWQIPSEPPKLSLNLAILSNRINKWVCLLMHNPQTQTITINSPCLTLDQALIPQCKTSLINNKFSWDNRVRNRLISLLEIMGWARDLMDLLQGLFLKWRENLWNLVSSYLICHRVTQILTSKTCWWRWKNAYKHL
jgi:hypothetical protein